MKQSKLAGGNYNSDFEAGWIWSDRVSDNDDYVVTGSDCSELIVATEQASNAISSAKLLKAYNEQGNYAVK